MGPVIEPYTTSHTFIDKNPVLMARDAWSKDIDVIIGGTSNEGLLMTFFPDPENKRIQTLEDSTNFTPFLELNLKHGNLKAKKFGKTLKELYYGTTTPTESNMLPYFYYQSDMQFWHGIQRAVMSRVNSNGTGKTFTYYFDILTDHNGFRKLFKLGDYPGVEHGACICYIFSTAMTKKPAVDSIEFKNVMKVIGIIANFAIYGQTGVDEWEENKSLELPLKCLHLTKEGMQLIDLPETARLKVWDEIYREAGVDLY
jgi:cholinesterase